MDGSAPTATLAAGLDAQLIAFERLSVIDFTRFRDGSAPREVADRIGSACRDVGFFYLTGHGVDQSLIDRAFEASRQFFALPDFEKRAIHISLSKAHRGYFPLFEENTDPDLTADLKEGFDLARDLPPGDPRVVAGLPLHGPNVWPEGQPEFRRTVEEYYEAMCRLAAILMEAFALALGLSRDHFAEDIDDPLAQLRLLHYPPQKGHIEERTLGCGTHTDYGCLTILAQDRVGGLQVRNAAGEWIEAPPVPGAFVINIGDQMARWTNDLFKATPHRVINRSGQERYSIPFFFDPNWDATVECLETCRDRDHPPRYAPVQAGPYLLSRLQATYNYMHTD